MALSDIKVKQAKLKDGEVRRKIPDGEGMYLLLTSAGGKYWRLKYRFGGKEKLLALGTYPDVSLADARLRRAEARRLLAEGKDPLEQKKKQKTAQAERATNTFEAVTREWHEKFKNTWSEKHAQQILRRLENDVFPAIGKTPIADIDAPELLAVLQKIALRSLETAHRLKFTCNQMLRWALVVRKTTRNPAAELTGALPPVRHKHFAAPTDPKSVAPLLRAIDGYDGSFVVKCALQLAPLTFVRPGELRHAEWTEVDFDKAEWNIPAERMKMKVAHVVPLSRQALAILKQLYPLTGSGKYLFPCHRSSQRCMSENAVNAGLRRMGFEKCEITGHGFRAMARTILDEILHFRPDYIEHQLAHAVKDPLGRAYNRTSHLTERRKMMQDWADYLDQIKGAL